MFAAVSFPGGGSRCYWQGGFYETIAPRLGLKPALRVGVSAGAFVACYTALGLGPAIRARVIPQCTKSEIDIDWRGAMRGRRLFPVGERYPELMRMFFSEEGFNALRSMGEIVIAISRPPRWLSATIAAPIGIAAYQAEKRLFAPLHPGSGKWMGFTVENVKVSTLASREELVGVLMASASVPPFMPIGNVGGRAALDGGLVDNVPVGPLAAMEHAGSRTLVLLTRRYKRIPEVPGRTYVQPSRPIGVDQFTLRDGEGIRAAYELGVEDGEAFLRKLDRA